MAKRKYIRHGKPADTVALRNDENKLVLNLLWGDPVHVIEESGGYTKVWARAATGWVPSDVLADEGLLELCVIDVGQGDGVLMRTPDDKWHLIDAGTTNQRQMTRKGAANFLRWKFQDDLQRPVVELETVIVSHPDLDHYGGLLDVLSGNLNDGREFEVVVERLFHSGLGRFAAAPKFGKTRSGQVQAPPFDEYRIPSEAELITELLDGKGSFAKPKRPFEKTFAAFAALAGKVPRLVQRLSNADEYLPGYAPGAGSGAVIRVLGPVLETVAGVPGLRVLGSESVTRNGHSVVLRVDYGRARLLLTGDLNTASQRLLLSYHDRLAFAADVAKGCHHGSDDIDLRFVRAMNARATIISSGDHESYAHPRPRVLGASARYGREAKGVEGDVLPPLLYSTELARSVSIGFVRNVEVANDSTNITSVRVRLDGGGQQFRSLASTPVIGDLVYGLVNVRTDGETVMLATRRESGSDFDVQAFKAGVDP